MPEPMDTRVDTRAVRAWLRRNGVEISDRGRIPSDLIARYEQAHGLDRIPDDEGRALPLLPHYRHGALLVRTDFSDDDAWLAVVTAVLAPTVEGFTALVEICEDRAFADLPPDRLTAHPSAVQVIEDNLTRANMWFQDFVLQADPDSVLRL
ncbi:DUF6924 domain-containing protein [Catenulispora rubra]|uniref:DUF6924 domain-containing protein n=1 Tax=Catenulispora rubra TaxID=280293 RepID=UPI00189275EB|nr:histone-like nucleoid-structuring protein Lsr2 [Catenulispora rubra]